MRREEREFVNPGVRSSSAPYLGPVLMDDKGVTSLEDLRETMLALDVHMLACEMSMKVMEIDREDLIDEVEDVVGVAKFIKEAADSSIQLFI